VLSLRYCEHVDEDTVQVIADHANPFFLKELYLDGCENICDKALIKLTKPRASGLYQAPDLKNYSLKELMGNYKQLTDLVGPDEDFHKLITDFR